MKSCDKIIDNSEFYYDVGELPSFPRGGWPAQGAVGRAVSHSSEWMSPAPASHFPCHFGRTLRTLACWALDTFLFGFQTRVALCLWQNPCQGSLWRELGFGHPGPHTHLSKGGARPWSGVLPKAVTAQGAPWMSWERGSWATAPTLTCRGTPRLSDRCPGRSEGLRRQRWALPTLTWVSFPRHTSVT